MKLFEYQGKEFFKKYSIPTPKEVLVNYGEDPRKAIEFVGFPCVIKAQVGVGGRGKAGGIKLVKNEKDFKKEFERIMGMDIRGEKVERVLLAEALNIEKEFYLGITVDRSKRSLVVMASPEGGVDIEEVAKRTPEKIKKVYSDILLKLLPYQAREIAYFLDKNYAKELEKIVINLYRLVHKEDCSLAEINPLVISKDKRVIALDAKVILDDNALYRHPDFESYRIVKEEEKIEYEAKTKGLSYIKLKGNIGCVVNGAGLAMATMDIIEHYGGEPANFLDVGGSSSPEKMFNAMKILIQEPRVKAIFVNIFGGITRCNDIAKGLLEAKEKLNIKHPIVVRLTGTNEEEARKMFEGTELHFVITMSEGAKKVINLVSS